MERAIYPCPLRVESLGGFSLWNTSKRTQVGECQCPFLPFASFLELFLHFSKMHPVLAYSQSFASISNLILESPGVRWGDKDRSLILLHSGYGQPYANAGSSPSFPETVFPNSLYGEILDTVWKQTCQNIQGFWGKCTKKDPVTWSLTSGHRITNDWHQLPGNDPVSELSSGLWTVVMKHPSLTPFSFFKF